MKIGILTQPLKSNYGGVLQNWALQQVLIKLGHEPITINYMPATELKIYIIENVKWLIALLFITKKRRPYTRFYFRRKDIFKSFVEENINHTEYVHRYSKGLVNKNELEALVVGSDQVWRPKYNIGSLDAMYCSFAKKLSIKKVSYAASFGTDVWEYSKYQTLKARSLIKLFNGISVREPSGCDMCKCHLYVEAKLVLDPTLLLHKNEYLKLLENTERLEERDYLAAYVLSPSKEFENKINYKAKGLNLVPYIVKADGGAKLSVYEWLALFRDAKYIMTDSFHGAVFSIIFEKEFECIGNSDRGNARFDVIRNLQQNNDIDKMRIKSIDFLKESLK